MTNSSDMMGKMSSKQFQFVDRRLFPMVRVGCWQQVRRQQQQIVRQQQQQQHSQKHLQQSVANESLHRYSLSLEYSNFFGYASNVFIHCWNRVIMREVEADRRRALVALVRERQRKHHIEIVDIA